MPRSSPSSTSTPTYEQALAELEQLVQQMEDGQLPLDRMIEGYKRGAELLALCRSRLAAVEQQVKVLEEGQLQAFDASAAAGNR